MSIYLLSARWPFLALLRRAKRAVVCCSTYPSKRDSGQSGLLSNELHVKSPEAVHNPSPSPAALRVSHTPGEKEEGKRERRKKAESTEKFVPRDITNSTAGKSLDRTC